MTFRPCTLSAAVAAAVLLTACGGGGGGTTVQPPTDGTVTLTGIVAKGVTSHADVNVYAVSNGAIAPTALATVVSTGTDGRYSISFAAQAGQRYVVQAAARGDGSTTHHDEVSNLDQALPAAFVVRSLLTADGSTSAVANLTPLSEMAVKVAEHAGGGITADNAAQAVSTVSQLLSFNPSNVTPATVVAATPGDQQKLAVLLAAVSELAHDPVALAALGCTGGTIVTPGDKTACVVAQLAAATQLHSLHLALTVAGTEVNVSQLFSAAIQAALADHRINPYVNGVPTVDIGLMTPILTNLACTDNCSAATATAGGNPVATGIAAAKVFFTTMVNDWTQMFSSDGATANAVGKVNQAAYRIGQAITNVQAPSATTLGELALVVEGDTLARGYASGAIATPYATSESGGNYDGSLWTLCGLYTDASMSAFISQPQDTATAVLACVSETVFAWNPALADYDSSGHLVVLHPGQSAGAYTYDAYAVTYNYDCVQAGCMPVNFRYWQTNGGVPMAWSGTLGATYDASSGQVGSFTVSGNLPPPFLVDGSALSGDHQSWSLASTVTADGAGQAASLSGTLGNYATPTGPVAAPLTSLLTIRSGQAAFAGAAYVGVPTRFSLDLLWDAYGSDGNASPSAEIEATLGASDPVLDVNGYNPTPTTLTLTGAIRTGSGSTATDVVTVNARRTVSGYGAYNGQLAPSAANSFAQQLQATATVTAPNEPVLEFSIGSAGRGPSIKDWSLVSLQYRRLVGGNATQVVSGVATRDLATDLWTTTLADNVDNLSILLAQGSSAPPRLLLGGSTVIGTVDTSTTVLTFTDGTFMSLALGL